MFTSVYEASSDWYKATLFPSIPRYAHGFLCFFCLRYGFFDCAVHLTARPRMRPGNGRAIVGEGPRRLQKAGPVGQCLRRAAKEVRENFQRLLPGIGSLSFVPVEPGCSRQRGRSPRPYSVSTSQLTLHRVSPFDTSLAGRKSHVNHLQDGTHGPRRAGLEALIARSAVRRLTCLQINPRSQARAPGLATSRGGYSIQRVGISTALTERGPPPTERQWWLQSPGMRWHGWASDSSSRA